MLDINLISFGKINAVSKDFLMYRTGISDNRKFKEEMKKLRKKHIILSSTEQSLYWRPDTKEEYLQYIQDYENRMKIAENNIKLAKQEFKERF